MATRTPRPLYERIELAAWAAVMYISQAALLIGLVGALWFWILIAHALMQGTPDPESRTFATATGKTYTRAQHDWGSSSLGQSQ